MCGIVGMLGYASDHLGDVTVMVEALRHRGPDSDGEWIDVTSGVALGHARLAVIDTSEAGYQPMTSHSGRYVISYNGEVYNHLELREKLAGFKKGISWRGGSDTETILAAFETWGIEKSLQAMEGMFAIAVWDQEENILTLARDKMGEKPLFYGRWGNKFIFASELDAVLAHSLAGVSLDKQAIKQYLRFGYVPDPLSIYSEIKKLEPGCALEIHERSGKVKHFRYWDISSEASKITSSAASLSSEDALEELHRLLKKSVKQQMASDVPLGAFLSGGIDSSLIVALMQNESVRPVSTFSIGFENAAYNEAEHAKAVAKHLGTKHTELYVTAEDALSLVPKIGQIYDEPFADASSLPTFLVSKMAREHVTVALSGDAGDELFCGYNRYVFTQKYWPKISKLPVFIRKQLANVLLAPSSNQWGTFFDHIEKISGQAKNWTNPGEKIHKGAHALHAASIKELYMLLVSDWSCTNDILSEQYNVALEPMRMDKSFSMGIIDEMMLIDQMHYLPSDILVKVDRAAMANSLETRVPFLNSDVVKFAWSLPVSEKLRDGSSKWPLRQILYKYVPKTMIERPKAGFDVPVADWLSNDLNGWARDLLCEDVVKRDGIFSHEGVNEVLSDQFDKGKNRTRELWNILMFQSWLENA